ncbi:MAG TPA: YggS family pyridoxal phosphate-dependent enzyme, partial [Rhabdochlamydiaceae bacterium]|nr:YggS family pyridoxal phosphate-dependent enzyme [Rhabdochlamydiaceae bacterium]
MKDKISENFFSLKAQVEEIALRHHRRPEEIKIIAVSKYAERNEMLKVYDCGCRDFGESRVQSANEKMTDLPADISWHFIGRLQSNKLNKVLGRFALLHSIDTVDLAELIGSKSSGLGITTSILLQVNISEEQTKQGFSSDELLDRFPYLLELKGVS